MLKSLLAIAVGASAGASFRWWLGLKLNTLFPAIPLGTLTANLIGSYIAGLGIALLANMPSLSPEWRLLLITGFCGGLTTFSTFSAETFALLQDGRGLMALGAIALHVTGSLLMLAIGFYTMQLLQGQMGGGL